MEALFNKCEALYNKRYLKNKDTHGATHGVIQLLQKPTEGLIIIEVPDSRVIERFVTHGHHALFLKSAAYATKHSRRDRFDKNKLCTEVGKTARAIMKFFRHENGRFKNYTVAINLTNDKHDMAVFIRKTDNGYDFLHFEPNFHAVSKRMTAFVKAFSGNCQRRGYHPDKPNEDGICSYLSWIEILRFLLFEQDHFQRDGILNFYGSEKTYLSKEEFQTRQNERRQSRQRNRSKQGSSYILQRLQ